MLFSNCTAFDTHIARFRLGSICNDVGIKKIWCKINQLFSPSLISERRLALRGDTRIYQLVSSMPRRLAIRVDWLAANAV